MTVDSRSIFKDAKGVIFLVRNLQRVYFLVGLYARVYFNGQVDILFDKETALPVLATELLSPILVGVILAAMFAATMSTADSGAILQRV